MSHSPHEFQEATSRRVFFGWEHPADPAEYMPEGQEPIGGWPSWWAFPEWRAYADLYEVYHARFDQGCFRHTRHKPTVLATTSWSLFESLHNHVLSAEERRSFGRGPQSLEQRLKESSKWAEWAPGFVTLVMQAWVRWGREQGLWEEVGIRRLLLAKLTEEELQRKHAGNDHVPFRKGCPICIQSQGRQRSHWRARFTGLYSASFDIAGPFTPGSSFDPGASGRDKGAGYKYFLACAFSLPVYAVEAAEKGEASLPEDHAVGPAKIPEGAGLDGVPGMEVRPSSEDEDEGIAGLFDYEPEELVLEMAEGPAGSKAVRFRARSKRPEAADAEAEPAPVPDEPPPLPPPAEAPSEYVVRTLCLATPLRSKRGREVLGAVQGIINRLESYGFPVHRYHADRAQELKSKALVTWLRDRGIHPTWTPGDTPAGNKAELAVKHVKALARKLLAVARLGSQYWPYAVLHASQRNWVQLAQELGVPQQQLLPFGVSLHARKRAKTGFGSHWQARTVKGQYMGQAPSTPGGHLVLVLEEDGSPKVLLTNTVYPLRAPTGDVKPTRRIYGKTAPHMLLRAVHAWPASVCSMAFRSGLLPGGEWDDLVDSDFHSGSEFQFQGAGQGQGMLGLKGGPVGVKGSGAACSGLVEGGAPELQTCSEEDLHRSRAPKLQADGSNWEVSSALEKQQAFFLGRFPEGSALVGLPTSMEGGSHEDSALMRLHTPQPRVGTRDEESLMEECLRSLWNSEAPGKEEESSWEAVRGTMYLGCRDESPVNWACDLDKQTVCKNTGQAARAINSWLKKRMPEVEWSALQISWNCLEPLPDRLRPAEGSPTWIAAWGRFQGGGLWVEAAEGTGAVLCEVRPGEVCSGDVFDLRDKTVALYGGCRYVLGSWKGGDLWLARAWVPAGFSEERGNLERSLRCLGFSVDVRSGRKDLADLGPASTVEAVGRSVGQESVKEVSEATGESWEVDFPHQLVDSRWVEGALCLHEAAAYRCKRASWDLRNFSPGSALARAASSELSVAEAELEWYEVLLRTLQAPEEFVVMVRSIAVDVPLATEEPTGPEIFLQTRTVSLDEARRELPSWLEAAKEEVQALEVSTGAVERITSDTVESWVEQGVNVIQIPGKAVLTRKSGIGRRRFRAVCCGSHLPPQALNLSKEDLYAGGIDALTVRVVLAYASQFDSWTGCSLDIKTAFLHAPVRGSLEGEESKAPVIVVKPPYMLVQLGLMASGDRWVVRKALYGLQSSPADWASYRDKELRKLQLATPINAVLSQSLTDSSMWLLKDEEGVLHAVMIVYVDDLAIFAEKRVAEALVTLIKGLWKTSEPDWADGGNSVPFCGMELTRTSSGWRVTQVKYLRELLQRYSIQETVVSPMTRWEEPELEEASPSVVKEAQGVTGALLWSVTRTRPDLMFTASKMGQWCTRAPKKVLEWGWQALRYVAGTLDLGLEFNKDPGPSFGSEDQLSVPRGPRCLEIYTDASHAPQGDKSTQCVLAVYRGSLLSWETSRQPFTALSSAEAELIAMVKGIQTAALARSLRNWPRSTL